jgi:2-phosphoglycerate kinase
MATTVTTVRQRDKESHKEILKNRQADRHIERQKDRQVDRQTDFRQIQSYTGGRTNSSCMTGISSRDNLVVAKGDLVVFTLAAVCDSQHHDRYSLTP